MARLAGLTLEQRVADWDGSLFTSDSGKHISVWRKPFDQNPDADGDAVPLTSVGNSDDGAE
ncbi:hypothetical protein EDC02_5580 [Micromonospora sp. Llam0]|nr:hypothetical protein EDC02_5580 [Micromonospora sp. Llam0]